MILLQETAARDGWMCGCVLRTSKFSSTPSPKLAARVKGKIERSDIGNVHSHTDQRDDGAGGASFWTKTKINIYNGFTATEYAINVVQACWRGQWPQSILTKAEQTCLFLITTIMSDGQEETCSNSVTLVAQK